MSAAGTKVSVAELEWIFEPVKNRGRWGPDGKVGTPNDVTPEKVGRQLLVRSARRVSIAIPIERDSRPDNAQQPSVFVVQGHDVPVDGSVVRFNFTGVCVTATAIAHADALCQARVANRI